MVLSHPLINVGHSISEIGLLKEPMNNTFSACPQVSDTVLSQYCSER